MPGQHLDYNVHGPQAMRQQGNRRCPLQPQLLQPAKAKSVMFVQHESGTSPSWLMKRMG